MKAIVFTRYGSPDVLEFKDVKTPKPAENEVLIKLCAASVNPLDWHIMRGEPVFIRLMTGLFKPKRTVLGCDIAGRVEMVGANVTHFHLGDEVFGGSQTGGFAEYVCVSEDKLALKPSSISFVNAAALPVAAITALRGLRDKGQIKPGQKVLIDGASGGVGTFAIQIAKHFGTEVTAVCSTGNVKRARSLGADHVTDYTKENFTRNGKLYDLIFAPNAYHSIFAYRRTLSEDGICVKAGGKGSFVGMLADMLLGPLLSSIGRKKTVLLLAKIKKEDLVTLKDLVESGKIAPVIDRSYPLSDAADAIRHLEAGHAQGKVVLTVEQLNLT